MKWEFVFNTNLGILRNIGEQAKMAFSAGYKFMCFNGIVYFLIETGDRMYDAIECKDTGLTSENLI